MILLASISAIPAESRISVLNPENDFPVDKAFAPSLDRLVVECISYKSFH